MAGESTTLLNGKTKEKTEIQTTFGDNSDSFVNLKSQNNGHRLFIGFLACMIVGLVALSVAVIYDVMPSRGSSSSSARKIIKKYDSRAASQLDVLNSMYDPELDIESGCESTILLFRHCEKYPDDGVVHQGGNSYCSWLGRERAYFLPSLFDPSNPQHRWPVPTKIFALTQDRESKHKVNYREIETVLPLAKKFDLEIDVYPFKVKVLADEYFKQLQSGEMCGKVSVISWKHELLADLAVALACGPDEGCPYEYPHDSFDEVWQIKYVLDPEGKAETAPNPMDLNVTINYKQASDSKHATDVDDDDDDDDATRIDAAPDQGSGVRGRMLKKKKHKHKKPAKKHWVVYGTKTTQAFDPLAFSLKSGDYPPNGTSSGGQWADEI
ncbi:expressed unknown protein [Seminavis robusta]|uniref:Uncharacterized protein n=1 Tax=Seminavis robusta TaxID=568900 RepID=A0A9N8DTU3_9STRA|nr:expressed unknown protein [Seminavis robusta]|eukprot:Sro271_g104580.1 n/a (382) ;mRNA; r:47120-48265